MIMMMMIIIVWFVSDDEIICWDFNRESNSVWFVWF